MVVRVLSLWAGVPDADQLRAKLAAARNQALSLQERQQAISYLTGAAKVLATLEKRAALAEYLRSQIQTIKTDIYYRVRSGN